eukprot:gene23469-28413_t
MFVEHMDTSSQIKSNDPSGVGKEFPVLEEKTSAVESASSAQEAGSVSDELSFAAGAPDSSTAEAQPQPQPTTLSSAEDSSSPELSQQAEEANPPSSRELDLTVPTGCLAKGPLSGNHRQDAPFFTLLTDRDDMTQGSIDCHYLT